MIGAKKKLNRKPAWVLIILTFSVGCSTGPVGEKQVLESMQIGDNIVVAIKEYKARHGTYPRLLSDLVPEFLNGIEQPTYRTKQWDYGGGADSFRLTFDSTSMFASSYSRGEPRYSESNEWDEDTK